MKKNFAKRKQRDERDSASTSPETYEEKTKRFFFVSKGMQSPSPDTLPVPAFTGTEFIM
jgi:hypothetical protein